MLSIDTYPSNKEKFIRLVDMFEEIMNICNDLKIKPIIYGSLAVLAYTKNPNMNVNDIDTLIPEKDFSKIISILKKHEIKYNYDEKWHVLQIFKDDLKIEFDSIDFWQKDLAKDFQEIVLGKTTVKIISFDSLKKIYKKASELSTNNPEGNKNKFEELNKIKEKKRKNPKR